jgi:regulatory protein
VMHQGVSYSFSEAKAKLEALCAYQERCAYELDQRMMKWGLSGEDRSALLAHLEKHNFLSDERFAEAYVSGKVSIKRWGRVRITRELKLRKISDDSIRKAFEGISDDLYFGNLKHLISLKMASLEKEKSEYIRTGKVVRFLQTKGYDFHEIQGVIKTSLTD